MGNVVKVKVVVEGSLDKALRQFKKKCTGAGIFRELRRIDHYEKPSDIRRRAEKRKLKVMQKANKGKEDEFMRYV